MKAIIASVLLLSLVGCSSQGCLKRPDRPEAPKNLRTTALPTPSSSGNWYIDQSNERLRQMREEDKYQELEDSIQALEYRQNLDRAYLHGLTLGR